MMKVNKDRKYLDVMLDLETFGTTPDSVIISVGMIAFDPTTSEMSPLSFYKVLSPSAQQEQISRGRVMSPHTVAWWLTQEEQARNALVIEGSISNIAMMDCINNYFEEHNNPERIRLWANGPSFDIVMLRSYYADMGEEFPIKFWNECCVRTIRNLAGWEWFNKWQINNPRKGTYHNAKDDAIYQAKYVSKIFTECEIKEFG